MLRVARVGCQVVIPYREEMAKRHLKVSGDLGQVTFLVSTASTGSLWCTCLFCIRNTTYEIPSPSRKPSDTPTSFTTWSAANTQQSTLEDF